MFLAVTLQSPHASPPTATTEVFINKKPSRGRSNDWERVETSAHRLAVPRPETWTVDTVRAIFGALRRYLPSHDAAHAEAHVSLYGQRPVKSVVLAVRARGWEAEAYIPSLRWNGRLDAPTARDFTAPMIATLKHLQEASPLALAKIRPVDAVITDAEAQGFAPDASRLMRIELRTLIEKFPAEQRAALRTLLREAIDKNDDDE
jgi:hypothetical protein